MEDFVTKLKKSDVEEFISNIIQSNSKIDLSKLKVLLIPTLSARSFKSHVVCMLGRGPSKLMQQVLEIHISNYTFDITNSGKPGLINLVPEDEQIVFFLAMMMKANGEFYAHHYKMHRIQALEDIIKSIGWNKSTLIKVGAFDEEGFDKLNSTMKANVEAKTEDLVSKAKAVIAGETDTY